MKTWMSLLFVPALLAQSVQPNSAVDAANLPVQRIGPNDLIAVSVYNAPELTRTIRVGADGMIRLPMLKNKIAADGLMPADLEALIAEAIEAEHLFVDPAVTVTIAEYHSRPISVMGSVKRPITFQAAGPVTLLDALARAEGLTADAGPEILVARREQGEEGGAGLVRRVPVKALLEGADPELNCQLSGGEEIRVPEAGKIFVVGNVKRPGAFAVRDNTEPTVLKAVAMAEGLLPFAGKQAFIYRTEEGSQSKNEIAVELKNILERKSPDLPLQASDVLYIPDAKSRRLSIAALEKILLFGTGATTALIYGSAVR